MSDYEDGELPVSPDSDQHSNADEMTYTPLPRPQQQQPQQDVHSRRHSAPAANTVDDYSDESESDSRSEAASSDDEGPFGGPSSRKMRMTTEALVHASREDNMDEGSIDFGGQAFQDAAARFQADRVRKGLPTRSGTRPPRSNNIWGSILQEEALATDLTDIGVGRRSLKELGSDRGAETYDFAMAQQIQEASRQQQLELEKRNKTEAMDQELEQYWSRNRESGEPETADTMDEGTSHADRRQDAIQAGKKRSIKERLGPRSYHRRGPHQRHRSGEGSDIDDLSIPQPGMPREIPDLDQAIMDSGNLGKIGKELAHKLCEPKVGLILGVVELLGVDMAKELFSQTRDAELKGGMMIKNGERRRTPGGVFLQLLRDIAHQDPRIDAQKVKRFFASQNNRMNNSRPSDFRKSSKSNDSANFQSELESFRKMNEVAKIKKEAEAKRKMELDEVEEGEVDDDCVAEPPTEEVLKPLPDILTCISQQFLAAKAASAAAADSPASRDNSSDLVNECGSDSSSSSGANSKAGDSDLPNVPPNSVERVERTLSTYGDDDDFLNAATESEDIELF